MGIISNLNREFIAYLNIIWENKRENIVIKYCFKTTPNTNGNI